VTNAGRIEKDSFGQEIVEAIKALAYCRGELEQMEPKRRASQAIPKRQTLPDK